MRSKVKRLPKAVYLVWDQPDANDPECHFLMAAEKLEDLAEKGAKKIVGTYKLVAEDSVQLVTKLSQRKLRQR